MFPSTESFTRPWGPRSSGTHPRRTSDVDPHLFFADPDPTCFHGWDPDLSFTNRQKKKKKYFVSLKNLIKFDIATTVTMKST